MVYRKFRPSKQWGVYDTRIFKQILNARNKRKMPSYKVSPNVQALGIEIYDPNGVNFFNPTSTPQIKFEHPAFKVPSIQDHPLYKQQKCLLFDGSEPFTDGIDQACALTKAVKRTHFPEDLLSKVVIPKNVEQILINCILHGERYDPTLERLPKLHDPVIFWIPGRSMVGTPVIKRCNIIIDNIFRNIHLNAIQRGRLDYLRCDYDEPMSITLKGDIFEKQEPFVVRGQPHIILQSPQALKLWLPKEKVNTLNDEKVPDITPIHPLIDLTKDNIYNDDIVIPRNTFPLHIDTILWSREQDQKYPWTMEQNAANAIMYCFGAALIEANRINKSLVENADLENPVLTRAIQLVNGRMDFVVFQLNTLNLSLKNSTKNIVWIEHGQHLYKPGKHSENYDKVIDLNVDTYVKCLKLLSTR